ncbi:MAG TPA: hypothetical protein DEO83_07455 [Lachnospiraceae bacterium]|nr:hypothetical protein [Lachnospiraceae bacterium]
MIIEESGMKKSTHMRKRDKNFRKLKKNNVWFSQLTFLLFIFITIAAFVLFASELIVYLTLTQLFDGKRLLDIKADLYSNASEAEKTFIYKSLDKELEAYIIEDASGNVIHSNGEDTHTDNGGYVEAVDGENTVFVFSDKEDSYLIPKGGDLHIDFKKLENDFKKNKLFVTEEIEKYSEDVVDEKTGVVYKTISMDDENSKQIMAINVIRSSVWIVSEIKGGGRIIGKYVYSVKMSDIFFAAGLTIIIAILLLILIFVIIGRIISSIRNQKRLNNIFLKDEITEGNNWTYFRMRGSRLLKHKNVKYAMVNIDFVKYRNYCLCHSIEEGEELLQKLDKAISKNIDKKKELSAHYASANFALLLMYDELDELKERLYELINTLKQTDEEHDLNFHVGIDPLNIKLDEKGKPVKLQDLDIELEYNNACTARATLEESDDTAIAVFDEKLFEEQRWFDTVVEHQRSAIENEEFVVYYQPKYNPNNDELSGAEALIRWNSPEFGIVPPGRFIPIFEKNGFITEIDHYMIEHVARDQKRWYDQGYKCVPVSVNVSRAHFVEPDLAEQIRNMVDAADARRSLIEIELTESAFFDDKKAIINTIKKLKEYGFAVSMDDFGSGYSSLNSLKDMPLDVLKLDAEFFRGDLEDERGEIVVSGAINLAKNLHMRTVAEGVEKRDQVEFLAKQGCDMIQGYIYDKPMPGNEFEKRMKSPAS